MRGAEITAVAVAKHKKSNINAIDDLKQLRNNKPLVHEIRMLQTTLVAEEKTTTKRQKKRGQTTR
jgi:hypothetical protein